MGEGMTEEEYKQCLIQLDLLGTRRGVNSIEPIYFLKENTSLLTIPSRKQIRRYVNGNILNLTKVDFDELLRKHIELSNDS